MKTVSIHRFETLYSWVVRSHIRYGFAYERSTYEALFGCFPVSIHPYLPKRIDELSKRTEMLSETLIQEHTLYGLFHFFDESKGQGPSLMRSMYGNKDEKILTFSFIRSAKLSTSISHRFCSLCIEGLRAEQGFGIYDIRYQLPGVFACPTHGIELDSAFSSAKGPIVKLRQAHPNLLQERAGEVTISFARFCFDVIEKSMNLNEGFDRERYLNALDRRGYVTKEGWVRQKILRRDVVRAVSQIKLEPGAEHLCSMYYLGSLLSRRKYSMHPIQHLLFGWWLFESDADGFFNDLLPPEQYALSW